MKSFEILKLSQIFFFYLFQDCLNMKKWFSNFVKVGVSNMRTAVETTGFLEARIPLKIYGFNAISGNDLKIQLYNLQQSWRARKDEVQE